MASSEEVDRISRSMLVWANTFPDKPVTVIKYEFLDIDEAAGDDAAMALSTIQGTYITQQYIIGGYQAEYQFKVIYRIKPGTSNDKRLQADEMLNHFGDWARTQHPDLGEGINALKVEPTTQSSKFAAYEDGYEDYQILMRLAYAVQVLLYHFLRYWQGFSHKLRRNFRRCRVPGGAYGKNKDAFFHKSCPFLFGFPAL